MFGKITFCLFAAAMIVACSDENSISNAASPDTAELSSLGTIASPLSSAMSSSDAVQPESSSEASLSTGSSSSAVVSSLYCKTETEDNCEYGSLTDGRDGKMYKTVKIGDQWWMAQNLDYTDGSEADPYSGPIWTSINMAVDSVRIGRLYVWKTAIEVCPDGWHLPNNDEWTVLLDLVGGGDVAGKVLKTKTGWEPNKTGENGNDAVGFSALPAGYKQPNTVTYATTMSGFWSANEDGQDKAFSVGLFAIGDAMRISKSGSGKTTGYSVRCIKN